MPRNLCESCVHLREVLSDKGSRFVRCGLFDSDKRYPKFPPQPVLRCEGWAQNDSGTGEARKED